MSARLVPYWTETAEESLGPMGAKGERGERIAKRILEKMGFYVTNHPSDRKIQTDGIDLFIRKKFGVQVKNNLKTGGDVGVEQEKLFASKAMFWMHVNEEDHSDFVFYKTEDMKEWVIKNAPPFEDLTWVPRREVSKLNP